MCLVLDLVSANFELGRIQCRVLALNMIPWCFIGRHGTVNVESQLDFDLSVRIVRPQNLTSDNAHFKNSWRSG